jgi:hypothetical protein
VADVTAAIATYGIKFPSVAPQPTTGAAWFAPGPRTLYIYDGTTWRSTVLT